jgi:hypothetical protein
MMRSMARCSGAVGADAFREGGRVIYYNYGPIINHAYSATFIWVSGFDQICCEFC